MCRRRRVLCLFLLPREEGGGGGSNINRHGVTRWDFCGFDGETERCSGATIISEMSSEV